MYKKAINMIYPSPKEDKNNYKVITYLGQSSEKKGKFLNNLDINVAYKTNNNLGKFIKNNKTKTVKNKKSGVYKLTCGDCPKIYIGQTGRNFSKRLKEHLSSFNKGKTDSSYANHLLECNHTFNNNFKILHNEQKGLKLNLLESLEINKFKHSDNLLNEQVDINDSPLLNLF